MGRKVVILAMIAVLLAGTIMPVRTFAIWGVVGSVVLKETVKHAAKSTMVRTGVRATSKSALERANQAWFSRFTAEQAAAFEAAAARAVPANTPGWLKVTIGASMFLSGVDLAITLWDIVRGGEEVIYPVPEGTQGSRTVVGNDGFAIGIDPHPTLNGKYYVRLYGPNGYLPFLTGGYYAPYVGPHHKNVDVENLPYGNMAEGNVLKNIREWEARSWPQAGSLQVAVEIDEGVIKGTRTKYTTFSADALNAIFPNRSHMNETVYVSDDLTGTMYVPAPEPVYVPNPHSDIFPDDEQAVEILVPDPAFWGDLDSAIWDNMDYIRNEVPEPVTHPYPGSPGDWTDITPPSAPDWADRLHGVVSTRFPFSLPWDLYRLLSLFAAEPERPHIRIDHNYMGMPFRFEVDFAFLEPYMPFFRGVIIVGFCVGLIMITRRIMGGGT